MKQPFLVRALVIGLVAFVLLYPIGMISGKISERQARSQAVVSQFASETSGPQLVAGPLLALTCEESFSKEREVMRNGKAETVAEPAVTNCPTAYLTPREMKASAAMPADALHRGIYAIRLYRADLQLSGAFEWPAPPPANGIYPRAWKQAYLVLFVRDPRGIKAITSSISGTLLASAEQELAQFSVRENLGTYASRKAGATVPFAYRMSLVGTSSLDIAPVADNNEISLKSDWPHPSFGEAWSPDERRIDRGGFSATWRLTNVATGGQAAWNKLATEGKIATARGVGVSLFDPVNVYALSYRAIEYAFLFILFTFGALALAEVVFTVRLHPIQYLLVGSAMAVFFLLLIALSEHFSFPRAYGSAAAACVLLLTIYLRHPLGTWLRAGIFFVAFVGLYGALYVLLRSEDNALLLGSIMTFALLAVAMIATRKLDWSELSLRMVTGKRQPAPGVS
jgi:inner membrane protein